MDRQGQKQAHIKAEVSTVSFLRKFIISITEAKPLTTSQLTHSFNNPTRSADIVLGSLLNESLKLASQRILRRGLSVKELLGCHYVQ